MRSPRHSSLVSPTVPLQRVVIAPRPQGELFLTARALDDDRRSTNSLARVLERHGLAGEFVSLWCETVFPRHARVGRSVRDWLLLTGRRRLRLVLWGAIAIELRSRMQGKGGTLWNLAADLVQAMGMEVESPTIPGLAFAVRLWEPVARAWSESPPTLIAVEGLATTETLLDDWLSTWSAPDEIAHELRSHNVISPEPSPPSNPSFWMQGGRMIELLSPRFPCASTLDRGDA